MPVFEEEQRLSPWTIGFAYAALIGVFVLLYLSHLLEAVRLNTPILVAALVILGMLALTMMKMKTLVNRDGVHIKALYIVSRLIEFSEIENAEAVTYRPLRDFGGWGLRISHKGKTYNMQGNQGVMQGNQGVMQGNQGVMQGNQGVQLLLSRNRRVLIGSQKSDELASVIQAGMRR